MQFLEILANRMLAPPRGLALRPRGDPRSATVDLDRLNRITMGILDRQLRFLLVLLNNHTSHRHGNFRNDHSQQSLFRHSQLSLNNFLFSLI